MGKDQFYKGGLRGILTEGSASSLMASSSEKHFNKGIVFQSIGVEVIWDFLVKRFHFLIVSDCRNIRGVICNCLERLHIFDILLEEVSVGIRFAFHIYRYICIPIKPNPL